MTDSSHACGDASPFSTVEGYEAFPHLLRLLARGQPVDIDEISELTDRPVRELQRFLRSQPGTDWDDEGRLIGFGLSLRPTAHRFTIERRTLHTWCATDTLLFTVILGRTTVAESTCRTTGRSIRVELRPDAVLSVDPPEAVVTQHHGGEFADLRSQICDHGHFFASPAAAHSWAAGHPDGQVLDVAEAFEQCRQACRELGWTAGEARGQ